MKRPPASLTASRVLTVVACVLLVSAFALATASPDGMSLGEALLRSDPHALTRLHQALAASGMGAAWDGLATPLLVRPAWLLPAMAGIVVAGLAASLRPRPRPNRRRTGTR